MINPRRAAVPPGRGTLFRKRAALGGMGRGEQQRECQATLPDLLFLASLVNQSAMEVGCLNGQLLHSTSAYSPSKSAFNLDGNEAALREPRNLRNGLPAVLSTDKSGNKHDVIRSSNKNWLRFASAGACFVALGLLYVQALARAAVSGTYSGFAKPWMDRGSDLLIFTLAAALLVLVVPLIRSGTLPQRLGAGFFLLLPVWILLHFLSWALAIYQG